MSNFSKIVIIVLILLSFFFVKERYGNNIESFLSKIGTMPKIELPKKGSEKTESVKKPTVVPTKPAETKEKQRNRGKMPFFDGCQLDILLTV